ncbi:MAG: L-fuculose-phosphate aldolase [Methanolobus sp.]|nr:L-fuculose-phosphate aldolase [Methanolobus sp.]
MNRININRVISHNVQEKGIPAESELREDLTKICHLIYDRGYNVSIDGNLSHRLDDSNVLITPSGSHNGFIRPEDLVVIDLQGNKVRGEGKKTSEYLLHTEIYRERDDINSVIHVHSPHALAASLAGVDLMKTYITVAPVPTTGYARISSDQTSVAISPYLKNYNWAILPRHGVVTWADTLWNAFLRLEGLEHYAKVMMIASSVTPAQPMSDEKVDELLKLWNLEHLKEDLK